MKGSEGKDLVSVVSGHPKGHGKLLVGVLQSHAHRSALWDGCLAAACNGTMEQGRQEGRY